MPHQTTIVELPIGPAELFATLQTWARDSGFSFHGKSGNRILYTKNLLGAKGWVSVESRENTARIEVWQSNGKGGPEFEGNIWVGWKMPLPAGPAIGPNRVYQKQVHTLFEMLAGKSVGFPLNEADRQLKYRQPTLNLSAFTKGLMIVGAFSLVTGILSLLSALRLLSNPIFSDLLHALLMNGTSDMILGTLTIASSRVIMKGRLLGIWLYFGSILMNYIYSAAVGEKLNYVFVGFSLLFIWQLLKSKKEWGLR